MAGLNHPAFSNLAAIYALYDEYARTLPAVCRPECSTCCTVNVTMTTLEGAQILNYLRAAGREDLLAGLETARSQPRFIPRQTTNLMAQQCLSGAEILQAENDPAWGRCLFLKNDLCAIYPARPFGCRCLSSTQFCPDTGAAEMDDFTITLNDIYYQALEHLDQPGRYGNMADILAFLLQTEPAQPPDRLAAECRLIPNHPLTVWMAPPEHQRKIQPILHALRKLIS